MTAKIFFVLFFFLSLTAYGQQEVINNSWVTADSIFIKSIIRESSNPDSLFACLGSNKVEKSELGFGYSLVEGSNGKGYVSIFYKFILFRRKVVSYQLLPQMPRDIRLVKTYKSFYTPLFNKFKSNNTKVLYLGYENMTLPIRNIKIDLKNKNIQFLMTPYSGIKYGDYGEDPITMLPNRRLYNHIKNLITPDVCVLLLNSKNPATRLYAAEFYYQHKSFFKERKEAISKVIAEIFKEKPSIETMSADEVYVENAKKLVERFSKTKIN